jgi:hypothetical protein
VEDAVTDLLTSPVTGAIVLALLLPVLVRATLREATGERPRSSRVLLGVLLALFVAQVTVRFIHG